MIFRYPIRQIAFVADDIRAAALEHHQIYGSGPFFVSEHIPIRRAFHRGRESHFDHSSAFGQWGDVMVEFMCQHDDAPSAVRDMYAVGQGGFHHIALVVDDLASARAHFAAQGFKEALLAEMDDEFSFVMMDAVAKYGHMIELYEGVPAISGFYNFVAQAAIGFDGMDPVRDTPKG